jgi:nitroreductase
VQLVQPITDLIRSRSSRRKYERRPIDDGPRRAIVELLADPPVPPFGAALRLELVTATAEDRAELRGLTTYGFVRGAPGFVVGALEAGPRDLEDFGFAVECVVLKAVDLGLGTCWLGGTFNRSGFADKIGATDGETVPAVLAIGHPAERRGKLERVIRYAAKSARRRPFESMFFAGGFDRALTPEATGPFAEVLELVRLGPSASNRQPWRIVRELGDPGVFHLFLERGRKYQQRASMLGMTDLQRIDMGIAICHFQLSARAAGLAGSWSVESQPDVGPLPARTEYVATWRP